MAVFPNWTVIKPCYYTGAKLGWVRMVGAPGEVRAPETQVCWPRYYIHFHDQKNQHFVPLILKLGAPSGVRA